MDESRGVGQVIYFLFFFFSFSSSRVFSRRSGWFLHFTKGRERSVREEKHVPWIEGTIPSVVTRRGGISLGVLHERSAITSTRAAHVGQVSSLYFSSPGSFVLRTVPDAFQRSRISARLIPVLLAILLRMYRGDFRNEWRLKVQYRISLAR